MSLIILIGIPSLTLIFLQFVVTTPWDVFQKSITTLIISGARHNIEPLPVQKYKDKDNQHNNC